MWKLGLSSKREDEACLYCYTHKKTLTVCSRRAARNEDLTKNNVLRNSTDVVEFKTREHSNTKRKSYNLTNVTFFVFWCFAKQLLVRCEDLTLSGLQNGRHSMKFSTDKKTERLLMTTDVPSKPSLMCYKVPLTSFRLFIII